MARINYDIEQGNKLVDIITCIYISYYEPTEHFLTLSTSIDNHSYHKLFILHKSSQLPTLLTYFVMQQFSVHMSFYNHSLHNCLSKLMISLIIERYRTLIFLVGKNWIDS